MISHFLKSVQLNCTLNNIVLFILLTLSSELVQAKNDDISLVQTHMNKNTISNLINDLKANKLDYLQNEKKITAAFELSKKSKWHSLHLQLAALYAELLSRQEQYDSLNTHLTTYLKRKDIQQQTEIYLLLLEAKLKDLPRQDKLIAAQKLANQLKTRLPESSISNKIIILRALAYYYTDVDDLSQTLNFASMGLELALELNNSGHQGFFFRKISDAYNYLDEKDKALSYAEKAVIAYEKTNDGLFTAKSYWSFGSVLLEQGNTNKAIIYFKKALSYFKSVNMQKGLTFAQYSIANILYNQESYNEATVATKANILLAESANVYDMQLASMILLSDIYIKQDLFEDANKVNDQVFLILDKFSRSVYKSNFLNKRYQLKRELGHIEHAFEAIELELFYVKKHLEATSASNIKTLQVKFEVKEKEDEILRLAHENNISELKAKEEYQQKLILRLITTIAIILVIASLFLFYKQVGQRKKFHVIASTDYLTDSLNRRGIMQMAEEIVHEKEVTIAIADLDYFKKINDNLGHDIGDLVLIAFTRAVRKTLRDVDKFGRYGGEEWLFILDTTDKAAIQTIFKRLSHNFKNDCINIRASHPSINWEITFSMGAAISNSKSNNLDDLIKHADDLLYQAKNNGRDQIIID